MNWRTLPIWLLMGTGIIGGVATLIVLLGSAARQREQKEQQQQQQQAAQRDLQRTTTNTASASAAPPNTIRNWKSSMRKEGYTQAEFQGASAQVVGPSTFDVAAFKVTTFKPDGEADVTAESPACRVSLTTNGFVVSSPGPIKLFQEEGRYSLTGEGFHWDHGAQRLIVSNNVQSTLLLKIPRNPARPGT